MTVMEKAMLPSAFDVQRTLEELQNEVNKIAADRSLGRAGLHARHLVKALRDNDHSLAKKYSRSLSQISFEALHSGPWHAVSVAWREIHSLAAIADATATIQHCADDPSPSTGQLTDAVRECLRSLDLALLVGGPSCAKLIHPMIDHLHARTGDSQSDPLPSSKIQLHLSSGASSDAEIQAQPCFKNTVCLEDGLRNSFTEQFGGRCTWLEATQPPSLIQFEDLYMAKDRPVLLEGIADAWPAMQRWTAPGYLEAALGHRTLPVEIGSSYLADAWGQKLMTFADFLAEAFGAQRGVHSMHRATADASHSAQPPAVPAVASSPIKPRDKFNPGNREASDPAAPLTRHGGAPGGPRESDPVHDRSCALMTPAAAAAAVPPHETAAAGTRKRRRIFSGDLVRPYDGEAAAGDQNGDAAPAVGGAHHLASAVPEGVAREGRVDSAQASAAASAVEAGGGVGLSGGGPSGRIGTAVQVPGAPACCQHAPSAHVHGDCGVGAPRGYEGREGQPDRGNAQPDSGRGRVAEGGAGGGAGARMVYMAQHPLFDQVPALRRDIMVPEYCALGDGDIKSINAWIGPAGTVTPLHTDPHHNLFVQVVGFKYFQIYPPSATPLMYPHATGLTTNSSRVDARSPDLAQFPAFASARGHQCVIGPGQGLYLPPGWWHYVEALAPSISVSFWWS